MKPKELRQLFHNRLSALMPSGEIEAIFKLCIAHMDQLGPVEIAVNETLLKHNYTHILERLEKEEPIQYILGIAHFRGLDLKVGPAVLIPRPETEELVQWLLNDHSPEHRKVLDVGTGSGCIALALKAERVLWDVIACDIHENALLLASENAADNGFHVQFIKLDALKDSFPVCDVIISNPPYIPLHEKAGMEKRVLNFEPEAALFVDDDDPLVFYKAIIKRAKAMGAQCYLEIHEDGREALATWIQNQGLAFEFRKDLQGKDRMLKVF